MLTRRQEAADRLRAARVACGLSQEDVAGALDPPRLRQTVASWEHATTVPKSEEACQLAVLYGASLDWLLLGMTTRPMGLAELDDIAADRHPPSGPRPRY